ncbi:MAG: pseudouridine synthase [bacterium]|nr:pseudouridine synthase [bacterium]
MERLHKILARHGVASRREAERWIRDGRVSVNDNIVREPGASADEQRDAIAVDGQPLPRRLPPRVLMLHKPVGFLCTSRKNRERGATIFDLLPTDRRYFSVGRLDRNTSGLLLVTDDGDFALRLTHPRYGTRKTYLVETDVPLTERDIRRLVDGVELEDGPARAEEASLTTPRRLRLVLSEGRKRQVRRMTAAVGARVIRLHRTRMGSLSLGALPSGQWRELTADEVRHLMKEKRRGMEEDHHVSGG